MFFRNAVLKKMKKALKISVILDLYFKRAKVGVIMEHFIVTIRAFFIKIIFETVFQIIANVSNYVWKFQDTGNSYKTKNISGS